jgi:hypothetical protein
MCRAHGVQRSVLARMQATIDQESLMTSGHEMLKCGFGHGNPILQQSSQAHEEGQITADHFLDRRSISGA